MVFILVCRFLDIPTLQVFIYATSSLQAIKKPIEEQKD
jgi:hypothetical protein